MNHAKYKTDSLVGLVMFYRVMSLPLISFTIIKIGPVWSKRERRCSKKGDENEDMTNSETKRKKGNEILDEERARYKQEKKGRSMKTKEKRARQRWKGIKGRYD